MAERPIVLVGLMGSGKTSVATRVAGTLGRPLRDSDQDLQRWYGESAAAQAERYGAEVLHDREAAALREALAQRPPPVVAAAASVIEDPSSRAALAAAYVVWLDAPPQVLAQRMRDGAHRPHYQPDPVAMLTGMRAERGPLFADVADLTVDVSSITADRAAATIVAALGEPSAQRGRPPQGDGIG